MLVSRFPRLPLRPCTATGLLLSFACAVAAAAEPLPTPPPPQRPRLIVVLAIDQLARDRLSTQLPGGLGRLAREGLRFEEALVGHGETSTCPGHVALASGRHPGRAGTPANDYVDLTLNRRVYCVEDPDAAVFGLEEEPDAGRSPRRILAEGLGDWLKRQLPGSRVYGVSGKDRAAIALSGHAADGAFWYEGALGFTTSRYYVDALPAWVEAWNGLARQPPRLFAELPESWVHPGVSVPGRPDDYPAESSARSRSSPHPLRDSDTGTFAENVTYSPYLDRLTLEFAAELARREGLGEGKSPDLLALGLSATDTVGHSYGPESAEAADALSKLDLDLATFYAGLEARLGANAVLTVLSSDHGVLPMPEWLAETGRSQCPVPGGRLQALSLLAGLAWNLHWNAGPWFRWPRPWLRIGHGLVVDRELAAAHDVPVDEIIAAAETYLESEPGIRRVWTRAELESSDDPIAALHLRSIAPGRSGDLFPEVHPTCLISLFGGTSHGTPHPYDRAVPLLFHGPGVAAGRSQAAALTVDAAPTLAGLLGLDVPSDLDGRNLLEPLPRLVAGEARE